LGLLAAQSKPNPPLALPQKEQERLAAHELGSDKRKAESSGSQSAQDQSQDLHQYQLTIKFGYAQFIVSAGLYEQFRPIEYAKGARELQAERQRQEIINEEKKKALQKHRTEASAAK